LRLFFSESGVKKRWIKTQKSTQAARDKERHIMCRKLEKLDVKPQNVQGHFRQVLKWMRQVGWTEKVTHGDLSE
jgi:RIO-like serine/threonine protein kinase